MLRLKDGPAEGTYPCKRAPVFLRAIVATTGEADVLDMLEDKPGPREKVYVYWRIGDWNDVHLNAGDGKQGRGFYASAEYEHMPDVDGEALRDNEEWRLWATKRGEEEAKRAGDSERGKDVRPMDGELQR